MRGTKEKAQELVDKFINASFNCKDCDMPFCDIPCTKLNLYEAKQCALICVNELLTLREALFINEGSMAYLYLKEIKEEIEKL
jgi:hypothetical protein